VFQNGTVRSAGERLYRPDLELAEEGPPGGGYGLERRVGGVVPGKVGESLVHQ
jgi:hypothetical protein